MKHVLISGTWRSTSAEVDADVNDAVTEIIRNGSVVLTGGALGVDQVALRRALSDDPTGEHLVVIIPCALSLFAAHYRRRATEGVITASQGEELIADLQRLRAIRPESLLEMTHRELTKETYYDRNSTLIRKADELRAFKTNLSRGGVDDTVKKARTKGIPVRLKEYVIDAP